jgi:hypothetical protein
MAMAIGGALILSLGNSACVRRSRQPLPPPTDTIAQATDFTANALPVYRLVTQESLIDIPSRLLVLQVRLEGSGTASYMFNAQDLIIALPDGTHARVFDRARAQELLRRTLIAEADFVYQQRAGYEPGGIAPYSRQAIADMVATRLLTEGSFDAANPLQGYVVVDTGVARSTLDGTTVEVVAHRAADAAPARFAYELATAPHDATTAP